VTGRDVSFRFTGPSARGLALTLAQMTILPKHWWTATDPDGRPRDIGATTLEPPLGSGPYRVKSFQFGRSITYERVSDYWGRDLPVRVGQNLFQTVQFEYYRDATTLFEAFRRRDLDFRYEFETQTWASGYDFPAVATGKVVREAFAIHDHSSVAFLAFNLRRPRLADPRVRRALCLVYDFETANRQFHHDLRARTTSYFFGIDLAAQGAPSDRERALLDAHRDRLPPDLFTQAWQAPVNGSPDALRQNAREAVRLLNEAGFVFRDGALRDGATGEPFILDIPVGDPGTLKTLLFYKPNLQKLGIRVRLTLNDGAQLTQRRRAFDFDLMPGYWQVGLTPGGNLEDHWGSRSADEGTSYNVPGIRHPVVDALIAKAGAARTRADLIAATRALDRVLLWNDYVIFDGVPTERWTARWDKFGRPAAMPLYGQASFPTVWWWDETRAARLGTG
jgi:microcin C transport system substrate-binding protein